ncbi:PKD-like family lipoprotein [Chitinophaga arvensicola]|nr:PKD-like family lipoprotein [Chitinophaga arvensicola]
MKQLYIIAAGLLLTLAMSCKKDNSTYADHPLPPVVVSGLKDSVTIFTRRDTLKMNPVVENESNYDFYWTAYSTNFVQGNLPKADTLSNAKILNYPVVLAPGSYYLVFNVKDKKTGVIKLINLNLFVATVNMNGWYLLKDNAGKTDFDFIYKDGRIDNWISFNNGGKNLDGNAVKAIFTPSFKMTITSTDLFNTLTVLSEKDAAIYRIDNGKMVRSFDDMFFSKPATRKLQNAFQSMASNNIGLINDNKAYSMTKGALFTDLPSTYKVSAIAAVGAMDIGFDENSKSVFCFNGSSFAALGSNGNDLKNMNASVLWLSGYAGQRSIALGLFRMQSGQGLLVKLNVQYGYLAGFTSPLIMAKDTLPATHGLMNASAIGGNYDADYIYYANGNKIYLTDVATTQEILQETLPAGETVTCIQHIKYPQPTAGIPVTTDYLAIASYANGRYKIWLHKISSTGTIDALTKPNFEGDGRVSNVTYVEQGLGSRVF